jgi:hypothetical protein
MLDGSVTTERDTGKLHRDELDLNYSATAHSLSTFRDFCRSSSRGFTVR